MSNIKLIRQFVEHLPLCQSMGIHVPEGDEPIFLLPYSQKIIGDTDSGVIHGGAISTLLDTACGAMVITHPENNFNTATVDLRIDYMRSAKPSLTVSARAEVFQTTRHIAFVRGIAWDETPESPIATATGTFTFKKRKTL